MLKLYGTRRSRTFRCLWTLEEASVPYDLIPIDFAKGESLQPDFLKINPNGKVPVLVDGDLVLFESLAINQHIAKRYAKQLWPSDDADQSLLCQWTTWAMGELEGPHDAANRGSTELDLERLERSLNALRANLRHREYILGSSFTLADLNVASVLLRPQYRPITESDSHLRDWFKRCTSRQALQQALSGS